MAKLTDRTLPVRLHGIILEDSCSLLGKITVAGSKSKDFSIYKHSLTKAI